LAVKSGKNPLPPAAEFQWWYQYYFAIDRGREGYDKNRHDFDRLIWQLASPKWKFDSATFDRSAAAFDNQDHVAIVIHNYRWRLGLAEGESKYDELEKRLAEAPVIAVPTITLEGDANGAPHADPRGPRRARTRAPFRDKWSTTSQSVELFPIRGSRLERPLSTMRRLGPQIHSSPFRSLRRTSRGPRHTSQNTISGP
jgi:hypothetical protein